MVTGKLDVTLGSLVAPEVSEEPTPAKFYDLCERHDWWYEMSDDHRVWLAGGAAQAALVAHTKKNPALRPIYDAWSEYHGDYSNPARTKPERPAE